MVGLTVSIFSSIDLSTSELTSESETLLNKAFTGPMQLGCIERHRNPIEERTKASTGFPASSPQKLSGKLNWEHFLLISFKKERKLVLNMSYLLLTFSFSLSAAKKNCFKSLPPTIIKSTLLKNDLVEKARLGTSSIAPTLIDLGIRRLRLFSRAISERIIPLACSNSQVLLPSNPKLGLVLFQVRY